MSSDSPPNWFMGCFITILTALCFGACFGGCYGCSRIEVADGFRDSTVRKVSETGVLWKTWEVETLGDGFRGTSGENGTTISPETFRYSVSDSELVKRLQLLPPGKRVRIHYRKFLVEWAPRGESRYFITSVEDSPQEK